MLTRIISLFSNDSPISFIGDTVAFFRRIKSKQTHRIQQQAPHRPLIKVVWNLKSIIVFDETQVARKATHFGIVFNGNNFFGFVKGGAQFHPK